MRVWCGEEKEGFDKGSFTYFVEESCLNQNVVRKIKKLLKQNSRIYFGASEKSIKRISSKFLFELKNLIKEKNCEVIFEMNLKDTLKYKSKLEDFASIVIRIDSNMLSKNKQLKIRQKNDIYLFDGIKMEFNQIKDEELQKMYYETDKMLIGE